MVQKMNYQDNERGLKTLLKELKHVPGTFPPVYMLGSILISYDKLGQAKVIAAAKGEAIKERWLGQVLKALGKRLAGQNGDISL